METTGPVSETGETGAIPTFPLVLASGSPRRRELMALITPHFLIEPADIDETIPPEESLDQAVVRLASGKAAAAQQKHPQAICIGADTVVELDGRRFGKPRDRQHAWEMLCQLNARTHTVLTGLAVLAPDGRQESCCVRTAVQFRACSPEELTAYLDTGEPMDKAGAYGIQGAGAKFILGIQGDYYSVMGLPVARLCQLLSRMQ